MKLIDSHCHIDFAAFDHDRQAVLEACEKKNIYRIVVPGVTEESWSKLLEVCTKTDICKPALGLHPVFIDQHQPNHLTKLDQLITQQEVVAVGEIGLDFYLRNLDKEKQELYFSKQLIIAKKHSLPVIIHNRKAHDQALKLLRENPVPGGIIHNFGGSIQQAYKYIELGFKLGFGGMLTFDRSRKLRLLAKQLPIESIVLETDAPDLTVEPHRGTRNSPEYLGFVLEAVAEIKNLDPKEVADITTQNCIDVLNLI